MVIVMWEDRYEAFIVKASDVSLRMINFAMHAKTGWGAIAGKREWGHFKFAHADPSRSNSGLVTLILLAYGFHKKNSGLTVGDVMSEEFQDYLDQFVRGVGGLSNSTGDLMREMVFKGPSSFDAVMVYEALAVDFFQKARGRWDKIRIVYPQSNLWNDNPYYILDAPWTTRAHQMAARTILQFLMSEPIQTRALAHGFRPGNPSVQIKGARNPFEQYGQSGLKMEVPEIREMPSLEVIESLQESWARFAVPR
jgi:ABC-type Fe3+ transport system substrate-binding protein